MSYLGASFVIVIVDGAGATTSGALLESATSFMYRVWLNSRSLRVELKRIRILRSGVQRNGDVTSS